MTVALDNPTAVLGMNDLAIFPPGTADAGRLLVVDNTSTLKVLEAGTLGAGAHDHAAGDGRQVGVAFVDAALTVNGVAVPAASLAIALGGDTPDRLYYVNPAGAGTLLTSVALGGPGLSDEAGGFALAYHAARGTFFVMRQSTDLVSEIDAQSGLALRSLHIGFTGGETFAGLARCTRTAARCWWRRARA